MEQQDDKQRREVDQHEREVEASGEDGLRVGDIAAVQLRLEPQSIEAQQVGRSVAHADGGEGHVGRRIPGEVGRVIGGAAGVLVA